MRSGGKYMRCGWFMDSPFCSEHPAGHRHDYRVPAFLLSDLDITAEDAMPCRRDWPRERANEHAIYLNAAATWRRKGHTENARISVGMARSLRLGAEPMREVA